MYPASPTCCLLALCCTPRTRRLPREHELAHRRELTTFCGALLDKHEDEIMEALKNDDFGTEEGERAHSRKGVWSAMHKTFWVSAHSAHSVHQLLHLLT